MIPEQLTCGIAICTYNGSLFLQQQLNSIVTQTILPKQVVISDDHSDDGSWEILQKWTSDATRLHGIAVTLIRNNVQLGVVSNFEQACSLLNTDVIFLCDQDDIWSNNKIEKFMNEFMDPTVLLVHSDARLVDHHFSEYNITLFQALRFTNREKALIERGRFFEIYCRRNLVTGAAAAFRKELLSVALPFPKEWVHDEWIAAMAASYGRVKMLPEYLLYYRQHSANTIGVHKNTYEYTLHCLKRIRKIPRSKFFENKIKRMQLWLDRLESIGMEGADKEFLLREALVHYTNCSQMKISPVDRIISIWCEWHSGRYNLYSGGIQGVVRDLLYL